MPAMRGSPIRPRSPRRPRDAGGRAQDAVDPLCRRPVRAAPAPPAQRAGAYADQAGNIVTRWQSQWERPELWIFDLHHHLFSGDVGETIIGVAGLAAILFVVTGAILWWRTRRTFKFRLWPKRLSRPAIVMQHRDLGIVVAPLLLLSAVTGTMMIFKPFAAIVVRPSRRPAGAARTPRRRPKAGRSPRIPIGARSSSPRMRGSPTRRSASSRCRASPASRSRSG
jgi:uncharacterized iron-regulated membrane protein